MELEYSQSGPCEPMGRKKLLVFHQGNFIEPETETETNKFKIYWKNYLINLFKFWTDAIVR